MFCRELGPEWDGGSTEVFVGVGCVGMAGRVRRFIWLEELPLAVTAILVTLIWHGGTGLKNLEAFVGLPGRIILSLYRLFPIQQQTCSHYKHTSTPEASQFSHSGTRVNGNMYSLVLLLGIFAL